MSYALYLKLSVKPRATRWGVAYIIYSGQYLIYGSVLFARRVVLHWASLCKKYGHVGFPTKKGSKEILTSCCHLDFVLKPARRLFLEP
jgi:hypothetical protein